MLESAAARPTKAFKLAVLGIGNELNGDDAAGVAVARRLAVLSSAHNEERAGINPVQAGAHCILDAGLAPENFTGVLRRFAPDLVLMVDAAEMGEPAGTVCLLDWRDTSGFGPSTHLQPLSTLGDYLEAELGCRVALLGIQPGRLDFDAPLSVEVELAVQDVVETLAEKL